MIAQNKTDFIIRLKKSEIPSDGLAVVTLFIEDDPIVRIDLVHDRDDSLYYRVEEVANPDCLIEGSYPEYFPEVTE
jgi:hypothetical protein